ncbi:MAG: hypothetical protein IJH80_11195 [Ruminococcus sp.]|nr:hypothetical protein [Ruminococcus sp.]
MCERFDLMIKKTLAVICAAVMTMAVMTACANSDSSSKAESSTSTTESKNDAPKENFAHPT